MLLAFCNICPSVDKNTFVDYRNIPLHIFPPLTCNIVPTKSVRSLLPLFQTNYIKYFFIGEIK